MRSRCSLAPPSLKGEHIMSSNSLPPVTPTYAMPELGIHYDNLRGLENAIKTPQRLRTSDTWGTALWAQSLGEGALVRLFVEYCDNVAIAHARLTLGDLPSWVSYQQAIAERSLIEQERVQSA